MSNDWTPYVVQQGDHTRKLAFRCGSTPDEVWGHPKNAELAARRPNMDTLCPGDVLHLPARPPATLALTVGTSNRYEAAVPTVPFRAVLESSSRSLASQPFEVHGLGGEQPLKGATTGAAEVLLDLPFWVREIEVRLVDLGMRFSFAIGDLDPIEEMSGVAQRLQNLGYLPRYGGDESEVLTAGITTFRHDAGLAETGDVDDEMRDALRANHLS